MFSGVPSTFVRVSGCNLRCVWCDTPYASWEPQGEHIEVKALVEQICGMGNGHVVVTGGEPMIFDPVTELCWELGARGKTITVETAGTVFRDLRCHLMSVSPKLSNSTPPESSGWRRRHEETRISVDTLARLIERYQVQLKFVIGRDVEGNLAEVDALIEQLPHVRPERILLMPEGTEAAGLRELQKALVAPCLARGWRLSPRLHIELFGNLRGT